MFEEVTKSMQSIAFAVCIRPTIKVSLLIVFFSLGVNSDSDEFLKLLMFYMRSIGIRIGALNKG